MNLVVLKRNIINECSNFRLILFSIWFSFFVPFGFILIYYISPEARAGKDFFSFSFSLEFIACLVLYIPAIVIFLVSDFILKRLNSKKYLFFLYLFFLLLFLFLFSKNIVIFHNGIHRDILIFLFLFSWGVFSIFVMYKIMILKYLITSSITKCNK